MIFSPALFAVVNAFAKNLKAETPKCEAVRFAKLFKQRRQFVAGYLNHFSALFADNMQVIGYSVRFFVMGMFVSEVYFCNQMAFKEQIERMVNGCPRYAQSFSFQPDKYFICIEMTAGLVDFPEDDNTFRCAAHGVLFHIRFEEFFGLHEFLVIFLSVLRWLSCH